MTDASPARAPSGRAPAPFGRAGAALARGAGLLPFLLFTAVFLLWPTLYIVLGAFRDGEGGWTFANILALNTPSIRNAYWVSIKVSALSALLGCLIGFALAAAVVLGGLPGRVRSPLLTFSGVASNFAGVPWPSPSSPRWGPRGSSRCGSATSGASTLAPTASTS
jgi:putative spermidine/putrescine transport system permease protein